MGEYLQLGGADYRTYVGTGRDDVTGSVLCTVSSHFAEGDVIPSGANVSPHYFAAQGVGFHPAWSGSFLKSELVV